MTSTVYNAQPGAVAYHQGIDVVGLIAFLHKPTLIAALDALIADESDDAAALSHEAREKAEAEVMGDLLAVERDESELCWRAQREGLPVEHRSDISPLALLGMKLTTAPASNGQGTSWQQHAYDIVGALRR